MKNSLITKWLRAGTFAKCLGTLSVLLTLLTTVTVSAQGPIIFSTMPMVNQRVVTRFNLANFERIRLSRSALSCQFMPECDPGCGDYGFEGDSDYVDETTIRGQYASACQPACGPCMTTAYMPCFGGGSFWFHNYGDFVTQQERYGLAGYHADSYGLSLGCDLWRTQASVFGVAAGGAFSEAKARQSDEKCDTDSFLVSLYGDTRIGVWNLAGSIGYVHSSFETNRSSWDDGEERLFSKHRGDTVFGSFEITSAVMQNAFSITPFLSYDFIKMKEKGYGEVPTDTVDDVLTMNNRSSTSYLQTLGLRYEKAYYDSGWLIQPSVSAGWLHDYGQRRITTRGVLDGDAFSYKGTVMGKNRFVMSLGVRASLDNRTSLFVRYDGEYNYHYNAQTVQFGFGLGY